ncbi:MAG: hypothetical protein ABIN95_00645 [Mucilaginibacter sp.]
MKKEIVLIIIAAMLTTAALAQPEYDRARRENERKAAAQRESDAQNARNNAPIEGKWGHATGVFDKRTTGGSAQMSAETRAGLEQLYAERRAESERIGNQASENVRKDAGQFQAYSKYYESLGVFNTEDVQRLRDFTYHYPGKVNENAAYYLSFKDRYNQLQQVAATGSFDDVMAALEPFAMLPHTAFAALQKLEKRFPEKQRTIDLAKLQVLYYYYGSVTSPEGFNSNAVGKYGAGTDHTMMSDNFFRLARMYPDSVARIYLENDPYKDALKLLGEDPKKNAAEILRLQDEFLSYPSKEIIARAAAHGREFLTVQELHVLKKLAALHGVKPLDLILLQNPGSPEREGYFTGRREYGTRYESKAKDYFTPQHKRAIKTLAEEGDPEAMHLYGLRVAQGWEDARKEESLKWIKAAAEKGAPHAQKNLDDICWWEIKGLKDHCSAKK